MNGKKKQRESRSKGYGKIGKRKMNGMAKKNRNMSSKFRKKTENLGPIK
jgi:hypothetical protein